uniref:Succinyl-CoA:glutarate-CoA transferase n=1 Tax=Equus caballus TaxID=9796 RepID=A0A9L0TBR3_HORSE
MLARGAALRRTGLLCGRGGGRGLWTGRPQSDADNTKPLEGVKILDLTRVLAGPFATMNLGDLGAEIIKVERPGAGDDTRAWGPPFLGTESVYFLSVNRNKKSIAVNIKDPKGVKIVKELAAVCDVFVENYVPGKLSAVGLGYEDIDKIAPHIIYCSITGSIVFQSQQQKMMSPNGYGESSSNCIQPSYHGNDNTKQNTAAVGFLWIFTVSSPGVDSISRRTFFADP